MNLKGLAYLTEKTAVWLIICIFGTATLFHIVSFFGIHITFGQMVGNIKNYLFICLIILIIGFFLAPPLAYAAMVAIAVPISIFFLSIWALLKKAYRILRNGHPEKKQKNFQQKEQARPNEQKNEKTNYQENYSYYQEESKPRYEDAQEQPEKLKMPTTFQEACKVLGVNPGQTSQEYKQAWRKEALRYHPDKTKDLGERLQAYAEEEMKRINRAWEIIKLAE